MSKQKVAQISMLVFTGLYSVAGPAHVAHVNTKLLFAVLSCDKDARDLLERVMAIDSGTGDAQGLNAVGAIYAAEFTSLGAAAKSVAPATPAAGDNIVASLVGKGKGRILLIAHMDTVFGRGDVAKSMPYWEGNHYIGPGAGTIRAAQLRPSAL